MARPKKNAAAAAPAPTPEAAELAQTGGLYVAILGGLFGLLTLLGAGLVAIDPYNLYSWGLPTRLTRDDYRPSSLPKLLNVVAKGGYDTLLIGSSTAMQFQSADLQRELKGTRRAFAFTYSGARPKDIGVVMARTANAPGLRRVLLSYDLTYVYGDEVARAVFPFAMYDDDPLNDLRGFGPDTVQLAARMLLGLEYYLSDWDAAPGRADQRRAYAKIQAPKGVAEFKRVIAAHRAGVDTPGTMTCADFPAVRLIPAYADALARRGATLDVVIPAYSYLVYFDYMEPEKRNRVHNGPALATLLESRRCLLQAVQGHANVRVFDFDLDPVLVEDMGNYRDSVHLHEPAAGKRMLQAIDAGRNELTLAGYDAYATELRRRVRGYQYFNSRLP